MDGVKATSEVSESTVGTSEAAAQEAADSGLQVDLEHHRLTSKEELTVLIKACYPLLYVVSSEEVRVENTMRRVANEREKKFVTWSATEGMSSQGGKEIKDPLAALNYIIDSKENAIFLLRDYHHYMKHHEIIRRLRDVGRAFRTSTKNCIILSPVQQIPPELEKEITFVDFDLPTVEDINRVMDGVLVPVENDWKARFVDDHGLRERFAEAALGLTETETENVFAKSLVQKGRFDIDIIHSEKEQIIRKSGTLEFLHPEATFKGIGGLDYLKDWLRKRGKAFTKEARTFGLPQPKGILMLGVPGCGKSLTAKAIGSLWHLPLLRLDVGKVFGSLVGSSEENVRRAIKTAESVAPSLLWLDEVEKGLSGTQSSTFSDAGTAARVFGTFITWLQEKRSPVFVVATANSIKMLPPELLRKGRFDEIFFVDLPQAEERRDIWRIHITKRGRDPEYFDLKALVDASEGFSGSEIEQAVISSLYDAFDQGEALTTEGLLQSVEETVPLSQTMQEEITSMRDWAKTRARLASKEVQLKEKSEVRKIEMS